MNQITRHNPGAVSMSEEHSTTVEFNTIEELCEITFVKRWMSQPLFYRLSSNKNLLMAEFKEGKEWWVVGFLKYLLELPIWIPVNVEEEEKRLLEELALPSSFR